MILAKVEFFNLGGSVKDRIGFDIIEQAEREGRLNPAAPSSKPHRGIPGKIFLTSLVFCVKNVQFGLNAMKRTLPLAWKSAHGKFIEAGGNTTQSFGLGRIPGQIYALLYLSPNPLSLDDIASELGVSKASVSTTVRQLQGWGAVRRMWVKGDRKDYYEAETDFGVVLKHGLLGTVRKKLDTAGMHLSEVEKALAAAKAGFNGEDQKELEVVAKRLAKARQFRDKIDGLLGNPLLDHLL